MSTKPVKVDPPKDPDPAPSVVTQTAQEVQQAKRNVQKNAAGAYGRQKTILAGDAAADNTAKKTILGG